MLLPRHFTLVTEAQRNHFTSPLSQFFPACNCHGHSDTCYYDESVDQAHESLDIHGNYEGGGVCVGCRDYTRGINCEMCIDGTYRPLGIEPNDPQPCVRKFG